jgi:hypothetical protein
VKNKTKNTVKKEIKAEEEKEWFKHKACWMLQTIVVHA